MANVSIPNKLVRLSYYVHWDGYFKWSDICIRDICNVKLGCIWWDETVVYIQQYLPLEVFVMKTIIKLVDKGDLVQFRHISCLVVLLYAI